MLINAAVYKGGQKIQSLELSSLKEREMKEKEIIWAAFKDPDKEDLNILFEKFSIHELTMEDINHGEQLSKIEEYEENLFIVMKQMDSTPGVEDVSVGDVYIIANEGYVLTIRKGYGKDFSFVRKIVEKNNKQLTHGSGFILYSIMDAVVDRYFPVINSLEKEFETFEKQVFEAQKTDGVDKVELMKKLYHFKSKTRIIKNNILPLTDSVHKLFGGRVPEICEGLDNYFRDTHDHLTRICATLDSLMDSVNSTIQIAIALVSIEESIVTKKLASWAAIFAAVTCLAGIWGMNFKHMPELDWEWGYPLALSSMVIVALFLRDRFKKTGWL